MSCIQERNSLRHTQPLICDDDFIEDMMMIEIHAYCLVWKRFGTQLKYTPPLLQKVKVVYTFCENMFETNIIFE